MSNLLSSVNYIQVSLTNDEGLEGTLMLYGSFPSPQSQFGIILPLAIGAVVTILVVLVVLSRSGLLNLRRIRISRNAG